MDARRLTLALAVSFLIFTLWAMLASRYRPKRPAEKPTTTQQVAAPAATQPVITPAPGPPPLTGEPATQPTPLTVVGADYLHTVQLGEAQLDGPFRMAVTITNRGAAVERLQLSDFQQVVDQPEPYTLIRPVEHNGKSICAMTTQLIRLGEQQQAVELHDVLWNLRKIGDRQNPKAELWIQINDDQDQPRWRISKSYSLAAAPAQAGGYDLLCKIALENLADQPDSLVLVEGGPLGLTREGARQDQRKIVAATYKQDQLIVVKGGHVLRHRQLAGKPPVELGSQFRDPRLAWAAGANKFFTCLMSPLSATEGATEFIDLAQATTLFGEKQFHEDLTFQWTTTKQVVGPHQKWVLAVEYFCGPKKKSLLTETPKYSQRNYYALVQTDFRWCGTCSIDWLAGVMGSLLEFCHKLPPHNYGLAIIIMVLIVRICLHPVTKYSQTHMLKMQEQMSTLAPRMEEAKKKYANDRQKLNQEMMKVYREAGVNPTGQMLGCLPMMLQMPIWVALWMSLNTTVELRHAGFILWIRDLSTPDALVHFANAYHVPLLSGLIGPITSFNLLPLLLAVFMYLQQRFMSPKKGPAKPASGEAAKKAADQMSQQKKMMNIMMIFFGVLFYNMPSGLTTYIMTSSMVGMIEQYRIRKQVAEAKEKIPAGGPQPPRKLGRLMTWLQDLQRRADHVREVRTPGRRKGPHRH